jgi:hypothetical protein
MLFLEPWFWTFAAAAVVGFLLLPQALRIWWLLATSVLFYFHFAGVGGVLVVTVLATLCWGAGSRRRGSVAGRCRCNRTTARRRWPPKSGTAPG